MHHLEEEHPVLGVDNPHQLTPSDTRNQGNQVHKVSAHQQQSPRNTGHKDYPHDQREVPIRQKPDKVLMVFDIENQDEQLQEVLVANSKQPHRATELATTPIHINPTKQKAVTKQQEHQPLPQQAFSRQERRETLARPLETSHKRTIPQPEQPIPFSHRHAGEYEQQQYTRQEIPESTLPNPAKYKQANRPKDRVIQPPNGHYDYAVLPELNSRTEFEANPQMTISTSREQFSSREIFENKSSVNLDTRTRLSAKTSYLKFMNGDQKMLNGGTNGQSSLELPRTKRPKILKSGKLSISDQDIQDVYKFVLQPMAFDRVLESTILRNRGCQKLWYIDYDLTTNQGKYLLSCKKMPFHWGSTYNLSLMRGQFQEQSDYFLGRIQANFLGTIFNLYTPKAANSKDLELSATIYYSPEITCCKLAVREIEVYIKNQSCLYQHLSGSAENSNLKQLYSIAGNKQKITKFMNKKPIWRQYLQSFVLDFRGKSKVASVKNTILVNAEDQRQQGLLLAKKESDQFSLDISHPFSPLVGFGVAITGFDFKLASQ